MTNNIYKQALRPPHRCRRPLLDNPSNDCVSHLHRTSPIPHLHRISQSSGFNLFWREKEFLFFLLFNLPLRQKCKKKNTFKFDFNNASKHVGFPVVACTRNSPQCFGGIFAVAHKPRLPGAKGWGDLGMPWSLPNF